MKRILALLLTAVVGITTVFGKSFIGFEANNDLRSQVDNGLIQNKVNLTLTTGSTYQLEMVEGGEATCIIGGITFYDYNESAARTSYKIYNTYIQPNGTNREVRIPTQVGETIKVVLTEAFDGLLVNGESQDFVQGENLLVANSTSIVLKNTNGKPKYAAILSLAPLEELTVAEALTRGAALEVNETAADVVAVEGYVINAEKFDVLYKNQCWFMADAADATSSDFYAYHCEPIYNDETVKVLNGDKVRIVGNLKKYHDNQLDKDLIEINKGEVSFVSMVEGNHAVNTTIENINVAQALAIGEPLETSTSTEEYYSITGYVSAIAGDYSTSNKNQNFWIADGYNTGISSNAAGGFYVYRGKPNTEKALVVGSRVKVTTNIRKYGTGSNAIQSSANMAVTVLSEPSPSPSAYYCATSSWGYAGTGVTGGGNATPTLVTNASELSNAIQSNSVVIVTQNIEVNYRISKEVSNFTLMALPGVKIISNERNKANSGIFIFKGSSNNIILRNLTLVGPGAYDVNGYDLLSLEGATNVWVDHCDFQDGMDGNFDMKHNADNITVSWCRFRYFKDPIPHGEGGDSDDHRFSNLIGSDSKDAPDDGTFNVTYAYCWWDEGCKQRMVRCRNAELHFLNCYWNSSVADYYVGPENASSYFEGCKFEGSANYSSGIWREFNYTTNYCKFVNCDGYLPSNSGDVAAPTYLYPHLTGTETKACVTSIDCGAGATLTVTTDAQVSTTCENVEPQPDPVPTVEDLVNAGYNVTDSVVICMKLPTPDCYTSKFVYFYGSYNDWLEDLNDETQWGKQHWFDPLPGFSGWYVTEVPYNNSSVYGKPIVILSDYKIHWKYQAGDAAAYTYVAGKQAQIVNSSIEGESEVTYPETGAYIYELGYWKNHVDPCNSTPPFSVEVTFYPPYMCEGFTPAVTGDFNDWTATPMTVQTDYAGKTYYTATITANEGDQLNFRISESDEYPLMRRDGDQWRSYENRTLHSGYSVYVDCSNIFNYRFGSCQKPNLTQATATVLVPTDCGMDVSNGLYLCWWPYSNSSNRHYTKMTVEGCKYAVTFEPNDLAYSYFVLNGADVNNEGVKRTSEKSQLMADSLCWELYYSPEMWEAELFADADCSYKDHDYRPTNMTAVNTSMDTVLFVWDVPESETSEIYFEIQAYNAQNKRIFNLNPNTWDGSLQKEGNHYSYRKSVGVTETTEVAYWTLREEMYIDGRGYMIFSGTGDAFTIAGDPRIPHNLTITEKSEGVYTVRWESSGDVDHFIVQVGWETQYETSALSYDLTLADNNDYSIYVFAYGANDQPIGNGYIHLNTNRMEPTDITMYFYIPQTLGFLGEAGGAMIWRDVELAGEHIIPLVADGDNGHWYKATMAQFNRERFCMSLINASTKEAATKTLNYADELSYDSYSNRKFIIYRYTNDSLVLTTDYRNLYPHDYTIIGMHAVQKLNKMLLSWTANEKAANYRVRVYHADGETWWDRETNDTIIVFDDMNSITDTVELRWSVVPRQDWEDYSMLIAYSTFKAGPSPFKPKNLKAVNNYDGTFTFSWSPVALDTVKEYYLCVYDPENNRMVDRGTEDTTITLPMQLLFSGEYVMRVQSLDENWSNLGEAEGTFVVAPTTERDIQIRVMMTSEPEGGLSEGVKFEISKSPGNTETVDAVEGKYGWWSYTVTTDQYGIRFRIKNEGSRIRIYGDTCVEYVDYRFLEADCDARATDYIPHHLQATPNGDGTYIISWIMDATERVEHYTIEVQNNDSLWSDGFDARTTQCKTSLLPYTGQYIYTVRAYDDNWNTIGEATDTFVVTPLPERTMVLRVLEQPMEEGWIGVRVYRDWSGYSGLNIRDEFDEHGNATRWCTDTIITTEPAVRIYLQSRWGDGTEFWLTGDTCIEVDNGFHEVACDTKAQNFELTNLQAESLGNGRVSFAWECESDPESFYLQTLVITNDNDTLPLSYQYLNGDIRSTISTLNVDSVSTITWYVMTIKNRNDKANWLTYAYGNAVTVEPSAYAPKNLQLSPNKDGSYTLTWNAEPDSVVSYYQVQLRYSNGERRYWSTDDTCFVTPVLSDLGTYQLYVYSVSAKNTSLGWQSITFLVQELEEARNITVRLLLHPDVNYYEPDWLEVNDDWIEPQSDGNYWYSYTFSSKMPVQRIWLMGSEVNVVGDTCFEYSGSLKSAACDAVAHDYRLIRDSLIAVSEPGKVTFRWSGVEKSEQYRIQIYSYDWDLWIEETVTDTFYVYMVPDEADGKTLNWSVRPVAPHNINEMEAPYVVTLKRNAIVFSNLQVTTTDSITYHFSWTANTDTIQYEILIYQYPSEEGLVCQEKVATAAFDYTFLSSDSQYAWEVRAVNAEGTPLSAWIDSEKRIKVKPGLKAITNIQSSYENGFIIFTWDSKTPATAIRLYYENSGYGYYPIFDEDSLLLTHSFSYKVSEDGRYAITMTPYVEVMPGEYKPLQEYAEAYVNVFTTRTYTVDVSTTVGGQFSWGNPSGNYPEGYAVELAVYEEEHYRFVGWSDGVTEAYRTLIVSGDTTLIALFERRQEYTLTLMTTEGGLIYIHNEDTIVTYYQAIWEEGYGFGFNAVPADGYAFYGWSDGYEYDNRSVDLKSDTTVTAIFKPIRYATILAEDGGRVQVTGGEYDKSKKRYGIIDGGELAIRANADEDYRFIGWSDGDVNVSRTVVVTSDTTITARFEEISAPLAQYVVRVLTNNIDLGEVSQVSGTYYEGDQLTISALPKEFSQFIGWSDGVKDATRVITVSQDTTLVATFEYKKVTLTIHASAGGSVNDSIVNGTHNYDSWVTIIATPDEHYEFVQWSDGNTNAYRDILLRENVELTATFAVQKYLVTFLNADGSYLESRKWQYGQTPTCTITPTMEPTEEYVFVFKGWTPEVVPVVGNAVYTAVYDQIPNEPSAIDEIIIDVKDDQPRKVLINNTIYIIRGDKVYTTQGQLVK